MAEFCKFCAVKYGFEQDPYPLLCEGCGKFYDRSSYLKVIYNSFIKKKETNRNRTN